MQSSITNNIAITSSNSNLRTRGLRGSTSHRVCSKAETGKDLILNHSSKSNEDEVQSADKFTLSTFAWLPVCRVVAAAHGGQIELGPSGAVCKPQGGARVENARR
jgi:hypothetical protein